MTSKYSLRVTSYPLNNPLCYADGVSLEIALNMIRDYAEIPIVVTLIPNGGSL